MSGIKPSADLFSTAKSDLTAPSLRVGCAGWNLPRSEDDAGQTQLARYAVRFDAVEINTSFYRPHHRTTYQRWAATVGPNFRFAAKIPKVITHEGRLCGFHPNLKRFLDEVGGLAEKLGCLLVQLPPSLTWDKGIADAFFSALRDQTEVDVACEPRHSTWFDASVGELFGRHRIARVVADPLCDPRGAEPLEQGLIYIRLHGSPRMYYSSYSDDALRRWAQRLHGFQHSGRWSWCIFDNTAAGAATTNADRLLELLR